MKVSPNTQWPFPQAATTTFRAIGQRSTSCRRHPTIGWWRGATLSPQHNIIAPRRRAVSFIPLKSFLLPKRRHGRLFLFSGIPPRSQKHIQSSFTKIARPIFSHMLRWKKREEQRSKQTWKFYPLWLLLPPFVQR